MASLADNPISVTDLRDRVKDVVNSALNGARYTITRNSDEVAVLVGIEEWRKLQETLSILLDKSMVDQITESEQAIENGEARPADDVLGDIEKDLDSDGESSSEG